MLTQPIADNTRNNDSGNGGKTFADLLSITMSASTEASREASAVSREMTAELLLGQLDNFVEMQIAGEKSNILFELNLTTRNKVLDAYSEVMKFQV